MNKQNNSFKQIEERLERIEKKVDEIYLQYLKNKTRYSVPEAAIYLGVKKPHLYKLMHLNLIDYSKPTGKLAYFTREALDEFLQRNTMKNIADLPKSDSKEMDSKAALYVHNNGKIK